MTRFPAEPGNPLDPINVSALNQYAYCPRRCGLIYLEGEFENNIHTSRGNAEHERVDRVAHAAAKDGARIEYSLPIFSDRLGLMGKCDVVEFWQDGTVYPVEYKHGRRRAWLNDDVQVGAQAMCLEDMLGVTVNEAAVFHAGSKRRRVVNVDASLRSAVCATLAAIRDLLGQREVPPHTNDQRRCRECSLREICGPDLAKASRASLFDV